MIRIEYRKPMMVFDGNKIDGNIEWKMEKIFINEPRSNSAEWEGN